MLKFTLFVKEEVQKPLFSFLLHETFSMVRQEKAKEIQVAFLAPGLYMKKKC